MYDVIVIGGGPAGLTAGLFAVRKGLNTLIIDNPEQPPQTSYAKDVENYPGIKNIDGMELLNRMKDHAISLGCKYLQKTVKNFYLKPRIKKVMVEGNTFKAKTVVIATGSHHKKADVPGEIKFIGKGVSYCATCDAFFFKGKKTVVIGGGNAAVMTALLLKDVGASVSLIHRRDELRADKMIQEKLFKARIPVMWNSVLKRIDGEEKVEKVVVENIRTKRTKEIKTDGVFVLIGQIPTADLAKKAGVVLSHGFIKVNQRKETNLSGVFAAGDVTTTPLKQIISACGDGAIAADSAYKYIKGVK